MSRLFAPVDLSRCAAALDQLGADIERLGHSLCQDPHVLSAHVDTLQDIDRIAQYQRALARLLRADLCCEELAQSGLDDLIEALLATNPVGPLG